MGNIVIGTMSYKKVLRTKKLEREMV